jgi:hypothetical protein
VNWTDGKAIVQVRTRELDGGFSRVEISARFQGSGQNVDRFAPPRDSWDLESNGALEKNLIAALEAHVKSLHSSPPSNPQNQSLLPGRQNILWFPTQRVPTTDV